LLPYPTCDEESYPERAPGVYVEQLAAPRTMAIAERRRVFIMGVFGLVVVNAAVAARVNVWPLPVSRYASSRKYSAFFLPVRRRFLHRCE
jgi:hypothetical protein